LEAAGSGSNLGFNYSHLEKQDKESLTEVVNESFGLKKLTKKIIVAAGAQKTSIQLVLEAQQHKKYAQTTQSEDGVSSL
jgi:hypothetical protein